MCSKSFAAVMPFAEAFEKVRVAHAPREGHDRPVEMQEFLDSNEIVPPGSNVGQWRKLADVFRRLVTKMRRKARSFRSGI